AKRSPRPRDASSAGRPHPRSRCARARRCSTRGWLSRRGIADRSRRRATRLRPGRSRTRRGGQPPCRRTDARASCPAWTSMRTLQPVRLRTMPNLRVAVDVGGTFTDICILDEGDGSIDVRKVPSTADPIEAVVDGVAEAGIDLRDVVVFSHGTTVATNALITRNLPPAAMVTTRHFRDVIEIRRGTKQDLWDAYADVAPPYIRRRDRFEVLERIDYAGEVVTPLDEDEARRVAAGLRRRNVQTVAVCFVNAHANPAHELRVREILEEELPGVAVSTSAEVLPEIFEHERFSTTIANAVLSPLISGYVKRLEHRLADKGYDGDVLLLHSGGGVMTPRLAERFAVRLAASGIAAGAVASRPLSSPFGLPNAIGFRLAGNPSG